MRRNNLGSSAIAFVLLASAISSIAAADEEGRFFEGNIALYPKPEAVEVVQPKGEIEPDPMTSAIAGSGVTQKEYGNKSVRLRVMDARATDHLEQYDAGSGNRFLLLSLEWKNISPKVMVETGPKDRSMGAGSLFGGNASGGSGGKSEAEKDVAYKVPKWEDHLFIVADGIAHSVHPAGGQIPGGAGPGDKLTIGRFGQTKQLSYAFEIPAGTRSLALYLFDYSNGHIVLPLTGTAPVLEPGSALSVAANRRVSRSDLVLTASPASFAGAYSGMNAPEGWQFAIVDLVGKSLSGTDARRDIVQVDAEKYAWLYGDGGYLYPAIQSSNESGFVRFTPEIYKWDQIAFLVPESGANFTLGLRFGKDVSVLPLSAVAPAAAPTSVVQYQDGDVMKLHVFGKRRQNDRLIIDIGAEAMAAGKGLELNAYRQLSLSASGRQISVDRKATQSLAHGAATKVIVPPDNMLRFSLAFDAPDDAVLDYKGVKSSGVIPLADVPQAGEEVALLAAAKLDRRASKKTTTKVAKKTPEKASEASVGWSAQSESVAGVESDRHRVVGSARKLEPIVLAPLLKEGALPEQEPNDEFEQAMEVPAPFKVIGQIKGREDDIFQIRAVGEPRLWSIHAEGETLYGVSFLDASKRELVSQRPARGESSVSLNGLYLLPGWHWFKVEGKGSVDGEYLFQATPGDPPSPASEREPNNDKSRAQRLRFDQEINGGYMPGDEDYYRFSLDEPALVRVSVQPPEGMTVNISFFGGSSIRSKTPGEIVNHDIPLEFGDYLFRLRLQGKVAGPQPYRLLMERLSLFANEGGADVTHDDSLSLSLGGDDNAVKAFWDEGQRVNLRLTAVNNGATPREISLSGASSHHLWTPTVKTESVTLNPGETKQVPVSVEIGGQAPADEKVRIAVQAKTADGTTNETSVDLASQCDADPADPHLAQPLPESMLGGLNLAWASLGGSLPDVEEKNRNNPRLHMGIIDGYTPLTTSWKRYGDFPLDVPVQLAATGSILGITVDPTGCGAGGPVRDFDLLSSTDGQVFEQIISGTVSNSQREQVFSLPAPVSSGYLKLQVRSTWQQANKGRVCLGELKAVADPDADFSGGKGWNIAASKLGGHVVWSSFKTARSAWTQVLSDKKGEGRVVVDPSNPNEWVIGFHHNRAAQVREIRWLRQVGSTVPNEFSQVDIAVSETSPLGPWRSVGLLEVDKAREISSISFDKPVWARFVRFSSTDPDKADRWQLPATLQILERPAGGGYRSMLGEWGHYEKNSIYEYLADERSATNSREKFVSGNGSKAKARSLMSGNQVSGKVQRGKDEDWYKLSVPQGQNRLKLVLSGLPTLLVQPQLIDSTGVTVPLEPGDEDATRADYSANVAPGDYLLRVFEPIMSTIVTWDNSGSVSPYSVSIYQALEEFARGVAPQTELVNFLPFQDKRFDLLREEWTDQPAVLSEALNNYDRADASSNAEANLHAATKHLQREPGNKMLLILTDAASGGGDNRKLWQSLSKVMPHVFSVELHGGGDFEYQQDKMQDWADVNGGVYSFFRTQSDLDSALDRALCTMRRPVGYTLAVQSEYQKPRGPGSLQVKVDPGAASSSAVEIILDASGSMYKKIGDQTRIAIAKTVLTDLLQTTIPAGTPLALRIYGHREARSCRTDLELPLKPLVTADALRIIKSVDPQDRSRTPLADSLKMVAEDLEGAEGAKLVILLTDGEESCDGDPEEAVRDLKELGMDIKLNIVGMAIDSDAAKQQFAEWAKIGGGLYFDADSPKALKSALERALFPKYQLIDQNGGVTVEGVADGVSVDVAEGVYQLKVLTSPAQSMGEVRIEEGKTVKIVVGSK